VIGWRPWGCKLWLHPWSARVLLDVAALDRNLGHRLMLANEDAAALLTTFARQAATRARGRSTAQEAPAAVASAEGIGAAVRAAVGVGP